LGNVEVKLFCGIHYDKIKGNSIGLQQRSFCLMTDRIDAWFRNMSCLGIMVLASVSENGQEI
jgi:hypothetical protein